MKNYKDIISFAIVWWTALTFLFFMNSCQKTEIKDLEQEQSLRAATGSLIDIESLVKGRNYALSADEVELNFKVNKEGVRLKAVYYRGEGVLISDLANPYLIKDTYCGKWIIKFPNNECKYMVTKRVENYRFRMLVKDNGDYWIGTTASHGTFIGHTSMISPITYNTDKKVVFIFTHNGEEIVKEFDEFDYTRRGGLGEFDYELKK